MILYETISQKLIDLDKPVYDPEDMDSIEMIAKALSRTRRFNQRIDYTVAEHSMWMANQFEDPLLKLYALLHDAPEAITGDIPSPIVEACNREDGSNPIKEIQDKIFDALLIKYGLPKMDKDYQRRLKDHDKLSRFLEKRDFIKSKNQWPDDLNYREIAWCNPILNHIKNEFERSFEFLAMFLGALEQYRSQSING